MDHIEFLKRAGRKGGKAGTGKAKARTTDQAKRAAEARWGKRRKTSKQ